MIWNYDLNLPTKGQAPWDPQLRRFFVWQDFTSVKSHSTNKLYLVKSIFSENQEPALAVRIAAGYAFAVQGRNGKFMEMKSRCSFQQNRSNPVFPV